MKKIYLDCGTYNGNILTKFIEKYDMPNEAVDWNIYCFDPLTTYQERINGIIQNYFGKGIETWDSDNSSEELSHFEFKPSAVWVDDKGVTFYKYSESGRAPHDDGSTIMDWKSEIDSKEWGGEVKSSYKVDSFSLSDWILNNCSKDDFLVVKMNMEGSEYDVLKDMINTGALDYVDELWVDFHLHNDNYINQSVLDKYDHYNDRLKKQYSEFVELFGNYIESNDIKVNPHDPNFEGGKWTTESGWVNLKKDIDNRNV